MAQQKPPLQWLDTDVFHEDPATERLIIALSRTLQIPRDEFELFDSFVDLGGDAESANALQQACRREGIDIKTDDILTCHTLAELQTRITPLQIRGTPSPTEQDSSVPRNSGVESIPSNISTNADDIFSPKRLSCDSVSSYGSLSTTSSYRVDFPTVKPTGKDLESLLKSSPRVRNVCLVTPRAGPFDGQLVALVSILGASSYDAQSEGICLPPRSQLAIQKQEIRSLRMAVQEWGADSRRPQIWIPLLHMAEQQDGGPDTRKLQTWVQNLSESFYREIMELQVPEPRQRASGPLSKHKEVMTRTESLRSIWRSDGHEDEVDDMECFPLAPMQRLFFENSMDHMNEATAKSLGEPGFRSTQSMMLKIEGGATEADIKAAVEALVARHTMLRARFRPIGDYWVQVVVPEASNTYRFRTHHDVDDEELAALIDKAQWAMNPADGPVFAAEHINNDKEQHLYLVAHSLVIDPVSWHILVHDLDELLREGALRSEGSISFPHWVAYQDYEMSERLFEPTLPFEVIPADLRYWNLNRGSNCHGDAMQSSFSFSADLSQVLQKVCVDVLRTDTADVFLASLLLSFRQTFTDRTPPTLWKREHGRGVVHDDFNIMETIGWFTSLCPIGVPLEPGTDLIQVIKLMKDTRRAIPRDGIPFFTSQFSTSEGASSGIPVEVILNWVENHQTHRKGGVLQPALLPGQSVGIPKSDVGPRVGRMALFEVSVMIDKSGTYVDFVYNKNSNHQEKIHHWLQSFENLVLEAIGKLRYHEPELTLSDVPLLRTSYKALTRLGSDRLSGSSLPSVRDIETIYPITPAQQEILIAQSQNMDAFHVHGVYELRSPQGKPVETTRLCKAWESIVANKPALRSIFIDGVSREGLFDQVVLKKISPNMLFIEASNPNEELAKLPTLKTSLVEPRHRLSVCQTRRKTLVRIDTSQAICDLMSIHSLVSELCRVYSNQVPTDNEALHRTYLYHTASLDTAYSLQVWKTVLQDVKPCIFPRIDLKSGELYRPQLYTLEITREQLTKFCYDCGIEPTAVLQLAWALVLRTFVGMDQVIFGYQFTGRDEELLHGIGKDVGSFANVLPCSIDLTAEDTLKKLLYCVDDSVATAQKHQNLTMAEIQHSLRTRERTLFNTCFFFQDADPFVKDEDVAESLELSPTVVTSSRRTDCDISCTAMFVNNYLHANLNSTFLSAMQAKSVLSGFEAAVKQIMYHPARLITEVDLSTERDYVHLTAQDGESNQTIQKVPSCLHDIILRHGQTRPDAPAVCSWDGDLSYIQLATLVARLRTYLVNLGVGPGVTVPVVLEKNQWAPVILLAVLQAGACFVALDSQDQISVKSTIRYLNPHLVLATESSWKELGTQVLNLVIINQAFFSVLPPRMSALTREPTPEHAACVFVTPKKTSSGRSRSIFFTHSSLCTAFAVQGPALKLNSESRVLQLSAFNVDVSLVEILGTLAHGGCVCIPSPRDRLYDLEGVIARMGVNWSYMTGILARRINPTVVPTLQTICFRTRKLDADTYAPWLETRNVLLAYGAPDVCPLGISVTEITKDKDISIIPPPLTGRFWILNPDDPRKLMPMGAIGELAIDSPLVTPYRFEQDSPLVVSNPQHSRGSSQHKAKYLKTGHLVRYLGDGNIQFISSARDDIIVGGSAVDVAAVEQRIRRCLGHGVDVVVDKIVTKDSFRILAAFLQLGESLFHGQEGFPNVSLRVKERTFIAKKLFEASLETSDHALPEHSIPAVFLPLKVLPMSTSLKVDRRNLFHITEELTYEELLEMSTVPNPQEIQRVVLGQKPLPLTRPEEAMRVIWARILGISPADIKRTSSFFSVGGNKFLAAELLISCRKYGLRVSLNDILNEATLTEICRNFSRSDRASKKALANKTTPVTGFSYKFVKDVIAPKLECKVQDVLDIAEASSEQLRALELGMFKPRADITCFVLQFNGRVSPEKLESACEELTRLHPVLRTAFITHEHRTYQVECSTFNPVFQKCSCPHSRLDSVVETLVKQHQNIEFQPSVPVTSFTYLDTAEQGTLIIRLSKAQVDEGSAPLIVQHLVALYEDSKGIPTVSSFFDYMRASKEATQAKGLEYWTAQMDGAKMTEIISHSSPCRPTSQVRTLREVVKLGLIRDHAVAPYTLVKAAWAIVLATISGIDDIVFGEIVLGHSIPLPEKTDLSSIVGPLTNTIPIRVRFPPMHSTPLDLMKYIQRQRRANCRYESVGIQDLIHNRCTKWPSWTRFSSIVQHRTIPPLDGSATYNIGGTTFTYKSFEPKVQDVPDMLICSTAEGSERMSLEVKFPEDRVSVEFAQDCMRLLLAAVETLTHRDTLKQPMLQSAEEIRRSDKKVPLPLKEAENVKTPLEHLLLAEQRRDLETAILDAWHEVVKSTNQDISEDKLHHTAFYNCSNSLLTAHFLAQNISRRLAQTKINGIDSIILSAEDIIENPTMQTQLELIARRLREGGALTLPLPHHKVANLRPGTASSQNNNNNTNNNIRPRSSNGTSAPSSWRDSLRLLRGKDSKASIRGLSIRPLSWMKAKDQDLPKLASPLSSSSVTPPVTNQGEVMPELMDIESLSGLFPTPQEPCERKQSNGSVTTIDTIPEEAVNDVHADSGDVSPLSPTGSEEHKSMWAAVWDKAGPLSPRAAKASIK